MCVFPVRVDARARVGDGRWVWVGEGGGVGVRVGGREAMRELARE